MMIQLWEALLISMATSVIVGSGFVLYMMIGEVNRKLPQSEQIPYIFSQLSSYIGKLRRVKREYRRLYPDGKLNKIRVVLQVIGFILIVTCALRFGLLQ